MIRVAVIDDHAVVRMGLKYAISLENDMEFAGELARVHTRRQAVR